MDSSISFERYDAEFNELLQQIEKSVSEDPPSSYTANLFAQAEDLQKQMALEARSVPNPGLKRDLLGKVRTYKTKLADLQAQSQKRNLFGSNAASNDPQDRQRLLLQQNQDMLASQNDTLERARRTMQETETVALEITEELGHNRETLMSAHNRIREVSGMTGRAKRILASMNQRAVQQKMIMYGVAVALVLGFIILLYSMWH